MLWKDEEPLASNFKPGAFHMNNGENESYS